MYLRDMKAKKEIKLLKKQVKELLIQVKELREENAMLKKENVELRAKNKELEEQNEQLKREVNANSKNSHKPPSTEGFKKQPALGKEEEKNRGGQVGHAGKTLEMVEKADRHEVHHAANCKICGRLFQAEEVEGIVSKRQVFDIPAPRLEVVEHQIGKITCCGHTQEGFYPKGVENHAQYGVKIRALSVLLSSSYSMPLGRISQLLEDLYGCSYNESTAIKANEDCYELLEETSSYIANQVETAAVVHFDETGSRVKGSLHWFHVASTAMFTYFFAHKNRGHKALRSEDSILKDYKGCAIHDSLCVYFGYKNISQHGLCNAHILRELTALIETKSCWAVSMHKLLIDMYKSSDKGKKVVPDPLTCIEKYEMICRQADEEEPPPTKYKGRLKSTKGRNLLNRLTKHQSAVLAFAFYEQVPFTNNQAERDIRCLKVKQKVSNCFRTFRGAQLFARIQGFLSSVRKHTLNAFQQLVNVFSFQFQPTLVLVG